MIFPSMNWVVAFESKPLAFASPPAFASGGVYGRMKALLLALLVGLLMVGCEQSSPPSEPNVSTGVAVLPDSPEALDLDDNETLYRILGEATDLDSLRTFTVGGRLFYFSPNEEKPNTGFLYSGWGKEMYGNGKVCRLNQFVDGNVNGICAEWYYNGQKEVQGIIKEGKKDGLHVMWYENGRKRLEANYKKGRKDGLSTEWYKNGQKKSEENFANDKLTTSFVWKPNGEKCPVTNVKNGNGVKVDAYYEDGKEVIRSNYKDGERVN